MIDTHCHILPSILSDDGASSFKQALEMARIAADDGISKIIATPHIRGKFDSPKNIQERCLQLNTLLQEHQIPLEILPGGEIASVMDPSIFKDYTLNQTRYILIEFPHSHLPKSAGETLFKLVNRGLIPIIAHAERNRSIVNDPEQLFRIIDSNICVQITAGSLVGHFGRDEKQCARFLLKKGVVDILATDAHEHNYRVPILSKGLKVAAKLIGKDKARKLVYENAEAVVKGDSIHGKKSL